MPSGKDGHGTGCLHRRLPAGSRKRPGLHRPASGTFAYDIYDVGVNQILKGPIGFVGGVGAMVAAGVMAIRQMLLPAAATVLGGAFLLKADSVVSTLGAIIS
ncbi:hypothetical protein GF1_16250 [Desulfolithobacter dissulfuricans]|uniref:Uncharacterized protein n=1 Tax=Desulfolithobacter dissulfuricans TaxID=2795293 RepID=A0A915U1B9_9BACT|nr:hypothetical protein [Desulfolithobacter dissulfuricans]BCO09249.1 hypothetical protein GF1_16250 [Desulfolithobacter dissulfuricans]